MREVDTAWKKDVTLKEALRAMMPQLGQNSSVVGEYMAANIHSKHSDICICIICKMIFALDSLFTKLSLYPHIVELNGGNYLH